MNTIVFKKFDIQAMFEFTDSQTTSSGKEDTYIFQAVMKAHFPGNFYCKLQIKSHQKRVFFVAKELFIFLHLWVIFASVDFR